MASNDQESSATMDDDAISQFLAFTGASDAAVAGHYLEMSGGDLQTAVSLFMDTGGGGGGGMAGIGGGAVRGDGGIGGGIGGGFGGQVRAPDATRRDRLVGGISPGGGIGGMGEMGGMGGGGDMDPSAALMAAMGGPAAREMMRNMMAAENGLGGDVGGSLGGTDGMASTWADASSADGSRETGGRRGGGGERQARTGSGGGGRNTSQRRNNNDDADDARAVEEDGQAMDEDDDEYNYNDSDDDDDDSHDLGGAPNMDVGSRGNIASTAAPSLSTMFAQPTHLMHRAGGFMGAKNFAKDARRWLLVNVQSDDDFACHALNRDVWRDELVENLVREGFILWQAMSSSNEGQTYVARYKVTRYPHLAIIDPRTGSLLWRKEGWTQVNPLTAEQFVEIASDFCSRHSFDKLPTAARHAYAGGVPLGGATVSESSSNGSLGRPAGGGNGGGNKRPIHELTEEEQLQAAIRASMQEEAEDSGGGDEAKADEKPSSARAANCNCVGGDGVRNDHVVDESKPSAFEEDILSMDVGDEPSSGPNVARVQIRMPDGKRLVRKFGGGSPVKVIYAFVAQQQQQLNDSGGTRAFELKAKFPPQDLFVSRDDSISSCGLNGEAINVIWK